MTYKHLHSLRSIMALVDNQIKVKCIVDPGSQIIAMSEKICHRLGLHYDPTVQLNMQSANAIID
jgi:predicted aspartyl protease